jgi:tRNA(Ile2)-agmatinylcytidine synthase
MRTLWIGIDDTDSTHGGCTTYVARTVIEKLSGEYSLIGYPRLIRLNPNIPWKTRGNGALALQIGLCDHETIQIGEVNHKLVFAALQSSRDLKADDIKLIKKTVQEVIDSQARVEDKNTNPGIVFLSKQPAYTVYKKTVTEIVTIKETIAMLKKLKATSIGLKNKRGLIGATAAVAWQPKTDHTYELITYREQKRWGTPRKVYDESVQKMDKKYPTTFDNYDYSNHHNRIMPNSPCPILFGIRGDNPLDLIAAQSMIHSETKDSWILFISNQGSDDHLQRKKIAKVQPFESVIIQGTVDRIPWTIRGGHVFFTLQDTTKSIDCAAYEPTKQFRGIIRQLTIGDDVTVYGGVREQPLTINIEKIDIQKLTKVIEKIENPVCPICGKHMKSQGTDQGFKCIRCHTKSNKPSIQEKQRILQPGFYEVPVCARRHLSKPLKRM